jgi:hypothetical protein
LSSIFIKGMLLIDAKASIAVDGWHLSLHFWWTPSHMLEWHRLYSFWDTTYRIFHLDTNWWDTSPYVIAWVIHLIDFELLLVRDAFFIWWSLKVEDHLWNHHLVWLIPHVDVVPLERTFYHGTACWICQ